MTDTERLQIVYHEYERYLGRPGTLHDAVDWGLANGKLNAPKIDPRKLLIRNMGSALRSEMSVDTAGRRYRANAAVTYTKAGGIQMSLWGSVDLDTTPHEFIAEHLQQRRRAVVAICVSLKASHDHYNDAHPQRQLPLILDFTDDVAELDAVRDRWHSEGHDEQRGDEEDDDGDDPSDPYPTSPPPPC